MKYKLVITCIRLLQVAMQHQIGVFCPPHLIRKTVPDRRNPITFFKSTDEITYNTAHKIPGEKWLLTSVVCQMSPSVISIPNHNISGIQLQNQICKICISVLL